LVCSQVFVPRTQEKDDNFSARERVAQAVFPPGAALLSLARRLAMGNGLVSGRIALNGSGDRPGNIGTVEAWS
jgi:hypothetical protein